MTRASESFAPPFEVVESARLLGEHLRRCRLARGDTLEAAGQRCGLHRHTVMRVEQGDPSVAFAKVATLLHIYGQSARLFDLSARDEPTEQLALKRLPKRGIK